MHLSKTGPKTVSKDEKIIYTTNISLNVHSLTQTGISFLLKSRNLYLKQPSISKNPSDLEITKKKLVRIVERKKIQIRP